MAVLEQQYQGKISFFSNFNPGWWSMQTNAIVSGRRKRWKQQRLFLIFLGATLAVFGQLLPPPHAFLPPLSENSLKVIALNREDNHPICRPLSVFVVKSAIK